MSTPAEIAAAELLATQEIESLGACVGRNQPPDSYQDIVEKIRGHVLILPVESRPPFAAQCAALGVELFPPPLVVVAPLIVDEDEPVEKGRKSKGR